MPDHSTATSPSLSGDLPRSSKQAAGGFSATYSFAVSLVALLGCLSLASSFAVGTFFTSPTFIVLALFAVVLGRSGVWFGSRVLLSAQPVFVLSAALLVGTPQAVMVAVLGALSTIVLARPRMPFHQAVVLATVSPFEALITGWSFSLMGGNPADFRTQSQLVALLIASLVYYGLHTGLAAIFAGLEEGSSTLPLWRERYAWLLPSFLSAGAVAALVAILGKWAGLHALVLLFPFALFLLQGFRVRADRDRQREFFRRELARLKEAGRSPDVPEGPGL